MIWLEIIVLAIVQGVGEFLPISSSGHVVVGSALFKQFGHGIEETLTVNIVLHFGTLLAILVFYWRRILALLGRDRRAIPLLVVGSIPAALVGIAIKKTVIGNTLEPLLENPMLAGAMFPLTGLLLLLSARHEPGQTTCRELRYTDALLIGFAQAFAILPGISRSGTTIVAGLACGMRRDEAATFSFLLAIPAIGGAGLLQVLELAEHGPGSTPLGALAVGAAVAFGVGLAALVWLVRWLEQGWLYRFAWYVIPLGLIVILWQTLA